KPTPAASMLDTNARRSVMAHPSLEDARQSFRQRRLSRGDWKRTVHPPYCHLPRPEHATCMATSITTRDLETARENVIQALGVHFASDQIAVDELDRRLTLAIRATT